MELKVITTQEPAIKLYSKLGFTKVGVHKKQQKIKNQYNDLMSMEKIF